MEHVTVADVVKLMSNPDTVMITEGSRMIFSGYLGTMIHYCPEYEAVKDRRVKSLGIQTDISHKEWKERGLLPPMKPEEAAQYSFSDLQMTIYRKIDIYKEDEGEDEQKTVDDFAGQAED